MGICIVDTQRWRVSVTRAHFAKLFLIIRTALVKFLQLYFRPIEVEIQRSIVFLDNFLLIHESLNPDLCDLAVHLHREFDAKDIKIQARNLLFVYVVFPVYRDASLMRRGSFYDYPNNMRVSGIAFWRC